MTTLYHNNRQAFQALIPFLGPPRSQTGLQNQMFRDNLRAIAGCVQRYTLDDIHRPVVPLGKKSDIDIVMKALRNEKSTGGLELCSRQSQLFLDLLSDFTHTALWKAGEIEVAITRTTKGGLKNIITIYNQFCALKCRKKVNVTSLADYGGVRNVVFLMFSYSSTLDLLRIERDRIIGQAPPVAALSRPQLNFLAYGVDKLALPPPVAGALLDPMDQDHIEIESKEILFSPICMFCNRTLRNEEVIPRYPMCTHTSTFHCDCYANYLGNWRKRFRKPGELPNCPAYGCGHTYSDENMVALTCRQSMFLPDEPAVVAKPNPTPDSIFVCDDL